MIEVAIFTLAKQGDASMLAEPIQPSRVCKTRTIETLQRRLKAVLSGCLEKGPRNVARVQHTTGKVVWYALAGATLRHVNSVDFVLRTKVVPAPQNAPEAPVFS